MINREHSPYVWGGMGRVVEQIEKLSRNQVELTIIANHPFLKISQEIKNNVLIYRVPTIGSTFLTKIPSFCYFASRLVVQLQKDYDLLYSNSSPIFCKIERPFIVHFQGTRYGEYLACKKLNMPLHAFFNKLYMPFDRMLLQKADGVIALSENMISEIMAMGGQKKDIAIIPNGVDTKLFKPLNVRQFGSQEKRILYVGRLDIRKGIDSLFYAFKEVIKSMKVKLIIAGEGREKNKLRRLAKSLSIPVDFLGKVPHQLLPTIHNDVDLFVLPSLYEGVPLAALEAMACGTPTIISTACPDLGITRFEKGNVESLTRVLLDNLSSEEKLKELSQRSLKISMEYDWEKIVFHILQYCRKFI
jgi:glycosyltransferase involved in cell wall biosynthesis